MDFIVIFILRKTKRKSYYIGIRFCMDNIKLYFFDLIIVATGVVRPGSWQDGYRQNIVWPIRDHPNRHRYHCRFLATRPG